MNLRVLSAIGAYILSELWQRVQSCSVESHEAFVPGNGWDVLNQPTPLFSHRRETGENGLSWGQTSSTPQLSLRTIQ